MGQLFQEIFSRAKVERKPVALRTNKEDPRSYYKGYIDYYNHETIRIKSIDNYGRIDGYIHFKLEDVLGVEYQDRYLNRLDFLNKNKAYLELDNDEVDQDGATIIEFMQNIKDSKFIATINMEYDMSVKGFILEVNEDFFQIESITNEGEVDGISTFRTTDIERIFADGLDERKMNLLFQNREELNA